MAGDGILYNDQGGTNHVYLVCLIASSSSLIFGYDITMSSLIDYEDILL